MKGLPYEGILAMDEAAIREAFPFGAKEWKKRWIPVLEGEEPDRPLKRLLKDKKDTIPKRRLLHRDSSRGYTDDPGQAMKVRPDPGEAVDKETQQRFSAESRERVDSTPLWQALRELEEKGLSARQKESIRRRVEAARRASNKKAA